MKRVLLLFVPLLLLLGIIFTAGGNSTKRPVAPRPKPLPLSRWRRQFPDGRLGGSEIKMPGELPAARYPGMLHLHYEYGPLKIGAGQAEIQLKDTQLKPQVPGYITRFKPGFIDARTRRPPPAERLDLHHAIWLANGYPLLATGEELTVIGSVPGFGYRVAPRDRWTLNYMIHNLSAKPESVYLTWDLDFVPLSSPAAASLRPWRTIFLDVAGINAWPVFDAVAGSGRNGRYTFPADAGQEQSFKIGPARQFRVDQPMTLIWGASHLHPGGLWSDLTVRRGSKRRLLLRSLARYFKPQPSWNMAMTVPAGRWRVALRRGDILELNSTYATRSLSIYDAMGIMELLWTPGVLSGAPDAFSVKPEFARGLTHGPLPQAQDLGGEPAGLPDPRRLAGVLSSRAVTISGFRYSQGDLSARGARQRPPVIAAGQQLEFKNLEARDVFHTITGCRAPCNLSTGLAFPLADAKPAFDSGVLGYGPLGLTAADGKAVWRTPANLPPGTYTYFCRLHPFMRGSFRVVAGRPRR